MGNPEEALFDTWQQGRKQGMSAGIRYERERIIKLLEDYEWTEIFIPELIRLIKGENK